MSTPGSWTKEIRLPDSAAKSEEVQLSVHALGAKSIGRAEL
jgi:hypothetical protein